jgi:small subunit ribosomal protein S14
MARTSIVVREHKREKLVSKFYEKRKALKENISNVNLSPEERLKYRYMLQAMPRNSSACRLRNRCALTGRQAMLGNLPGLKKASW